MSDIDTIRRWESIQVEAEKCNMVAKVQMGGIVLVPRHPAYHSKASFGPFLDTQSAHSYLSGWQEGRWYKGMEGEDE